MMENMIKVSNLTKDYGKGRGVFDFSFEIRKGEVYGLIGTNGSGKTTTIRHMMGFIKGNKGTVTVAQMDAWKDSKKIKELVGYVPGQIDFPDVGTGTSFLKIQADLCGLKDLTFMNELIDRFKIDITAPLKRMSKGMKQKMALVAAFMARPDIYILDEPSTGLDPLMRDVLINLIKEEKANGKTVFMSSHIFKEVEDTCDAVLFIRDGHIVDMVRRSQYEVEPRETYTFTLESEEEYMDCRAKIDVLINFNKDADIVCYRRHKHHQFTLNLPVYLLNDLFSVFARYKVTAFNSEKYTLEKYYTNVIEKEEI